MRIKALWCVFLGLLHTSLLNSQSTSYFLRSVTQHLKVAFDQWHAHAKFNSTLGFPGGWWGDFNRFGLIWFDRRSTSFQTCCSCTIELWSLPARWNRTVLTLDEDWRACSRSVGFGLLEKTVAAFDLFSLFVTVNVWECEDDIYTRWMIDRSYRLYRFLTDGMLIGKERE
jgi:hypothetical protein